MYLYLSLIDFSDSKLILYSQIKLEMKVYNLNSCKLFTKHFNDKVSDLFIPE